MIHELLFNLYNNPSYSSESNCQASSHLLELPQFLHPGEARLLQIITEIAAEYHKIVAFTDTVLGQPCVEALTSPQKCFKNGLYLKAFCNGLQDVLSDYRKEIIRLEQTFLENPQLPLAFILSSVEKYRGIFEFLLSLIGKIQKDNLHGCLIFNILDKYNIHQTISINQSGSDRIEEAAEKLIKRMNVVFYQHLRNWIIYGDLVDPYEEFFICDGKVDDEHFALRDQPDSVSTTTLNMKSKIKRPPSIRKFFINWNLVPKIVTEDAAESILFMGRIVWIFRNKPESVEKTNDYKTKFKKDIWEEKDAEYYRKIQDLAKHKFSKVQFDETLEECRVKLTKYLWSVMLQEGHLVEHLRLIRDFYALGRGELFQQFLSVSDSSLLNIPSESIVQHINIIFQETARKIYGENDKTYSRFEFTSPTAEISRINPWLKLQLNFEITWPLHILFHPEVMKLYNKLFCYLLRLKKTQINVHRIWSNHILCRQKIDKRVFTLRQNLMFLVDNLQYYTQVNVIEAQFSILLKAVETANEFEDIIKIHQEFLTNLLAKTFVLTPNENPSQEKKHRLYQTSTLQDSVPTKVYNVVTKLLELCDEFCLVAGVWELELTEADLVELTALQKKTDIAIQSLLFVLTNLHGKVKGGHLLELLMHLDFNRFFLKEYSSKNQTDFNLTVALN